MLHDREYGNIKLTSHLQERIGTLPCPAPYPQWLDSRPSLVALPLTAERCFPQPTAASLESQLGNRSTNFPLSFVQMPDYGLILGISHRREVRLVQVYHPFAGGRGNRSAVSEGTLEFGVCQWVVLT
jgi:hypothetical protein